MKISESRLRQIIREELTSGEAPKNKTVYFQFSIPYSTFVEWVSKNGALQRGQDVTDLFEGDLEAPLSAVVVNPDGGQKIVDEPHGPVVEFGFPDRTKAADWAWSYFIVRDKDQVGRGFTQPSVLARGANEPDTGRY